MIYPLLWLLLEGKMISNIVNHHMIAARIREEVHVHHLMAQAPVLTGAIGELSALTVLHARCCITAYFERRVKRMPAFRALFDRAVVQPVTETMARSDSIMSLLTSRKRKYATLRMVGSDSWVPLNFLHFPGSGTKG